jgi:hypothetical protein
MRRVSAWLRAGLAAAAAPALLISVSGCTSGSGITAGVLQTSISRTFASLYVLQPASR